MIPRGCEEDLLSNENEETSLSVHETEPEVKKISNKRKPGNSNI